MYISMDFGKCMTCIHHYSFIHNTFTTLNIIACRIKAKSISHYYNEYLREREREKLQFFLRWKCNDGNEKSQFGDYHKNNWSKQELIIESNASYFRKTHFFTCSQNISPWDTLITEGKILTSHWRKLADTI